MKKVTLIKQLIDLNQSLCSGMHVENLQRLTKKELIIISDLTAVLTFKLHSLRPKRLRISLLNVGDKSIDYRVEFHGKV